MSDGPPHFQDLPVVDREGTTFGTVTRAFLDEDPAWIIVQPVGSGTPRLVPVESARTDEGTVVIPFIERWLESGPTVDETDLSTSSDHEAPGATPMP